MSGFVDRPELNVVPAYVEEVVVVTSTAYRSTRHYLPVGQFPRSWYSRPAAFTGRAEVPSSALERLIDIIVARRRRNASGPARKER